MGEGAMLKGPGENTGIIYGNHLYHIGENNYCNANIAGLVENFRCMVVLNCSMAIYATVKKARVIN